MWARGERGKEEKHFSTVRLKPCARDGRGRTVCTDKRCLIQSQGIRKIMAMTVFKMEPEMKLNPTKSGREVLQSIRNDVCKVQSQERV